jgi:hypothetical protein
MKHHSCWVEGKSFIYNIPFLFTGNAHSIVAVIIVVAVLPSNYEWSSVFFLRGYRL